MCNLKNIKKIKSTFILHLPNSMLLQQTQKQSKHSKLLCSDWESRISIKIIAIEEKTSQTSLNILSAINS